MKKIFIALGIVLLTAAMLTTGCSDKTKQTKSVELKPKLKVAASVYPVYAFAKEVGGDKIDLSLIVQTGVEPHDFEPTPKDLISIKSADIFLYHGANFEPWIPKLVKDDILGKAMPVEVSKNILLLKEAKETKETTQKTAKEESLTEPGGEAKEHSHHEGDIDPHVWLDPLRARDEVNNIAEAFAAYDSENASYYKGNAIRFNSELAKLHAEFLEATVSAKGKEMVVGHAAFGYLADRYNLNQIAVMGLFPDAEPTPETISSIIKLCHDRQVKYIFTETAAPSKLMETVARETDCRILTLNTIEMLTEDDIAQNKNYLSIMRENLAVIKLAFGG